MVISTHGIFSRGIELELLWVRLDITMKLVEKLYSNNIHLREKARKSSLFIWATLWCWGNKYLSDLHEKVENDK